MVNKTEENGRIKLTWPQVVQAVSVLALVLGAWYDLRGKVEMVTQRLVALEARSQVTAFTKEDAEALRRAITDEIKTSGGRR